MKKIQLEICCGTACYILGASKLVGIEERLPEEWRDCVDVNILPCLDLCTSEKLDGAPFVRIDGAIVAKATPERILERIQNILEGDTLESANNLNDNNNIKVNEVDTENFNGGEK